MFYYKPTDPSRSDAWREYDIFNSYIEGEHVLVSEDLISGCLVTTAFPAKIHTVTGIDKDIVFKYYAIPIMVWLPLLVYWLTRKWVKDYQAFLIALLIIAQPYFTISPMAARVVIATTFVMAGLLVVLSTQRYRVKIGLLILISIGIVLSHYGTAFITIIFLAGWVGLGLFFKLIIRTNFGSYRAILLYLLILVIGSGIWQGVVTQIPMSQMGVVARGSIENITDASITDLVAPETTSKAPKVSAPTIFSKLDSRDTMVQVAFGSTFGEMKNAERSEFILTWLLVLLSFFGIIIGNPKQKIWAAGVIGFALLASGVIIPKIGLAYGIQRIYFHMSWVLLLYTMYGTERISNILKLPDKLISTVITGAYFFTASGLLYYALGYSRFY